MDAKPNHKSRQKPPCKKVSYVSEEFALEHIAIMWKKFPDRNNPISAYLCPMCKTWHTTKQENVQRLKKKLVENELLLKSREQELFNVKNQLNAIKDVRRDAITRKYESKIRNLENKLEQQKLKFQKQHDQLLEQNNSSIEIIRQFKNILLTVRTKYINTDILLELFKGKI